MLRPNVVRGGVAAAAATVVVAGLLVAAIPAQGAPVAVPRGPAGVTETATPTPTDTVSPTPTPTDTTPTPIPTPTPTPTADPRLLPDLVALPAGDLAVQVRRDGRRLRFSSSLGNIGDGPIEVRPNRLLPCPEGQHNSTQIVYLDGNGNGRFNPRMDTAFVRNRAGCMVYHPLHHHWHFKASARYTLLDPREEGRVIVTARRKVSFCLRDTARMPTRYDGIEHPLAYAACSRRSPQGITAGWMDVYQSFLAGQALRLPADLANGLYCLETVVDPIDQLLESDDDNNTSVRALRIRRNTVVKQPAARCR